MVVHSIALLVAFGEAGAGHAFAQAALLEKVVFEAADLLVEQIACQFDDADHGIGADGRVGVFDGFAEGFVVGAGSAVEPAQAGGVRVVAGPFLQTTDTQEVAVVGEEFLEAGTCNVSQLVFSFLGCAGGHAAFDDVLLAGTGGLDHLVAGAVVRVEEAIAEAHGGVVDDFGLLVGE